MTRKRLLGVLLALSAVLSLMGQRASVRLRQAMAVLLVPLSDAPMYAVTKLKSDIPDPARSRLTDEQARDLREQNEYLRHLAAQWRSQWESYRQRAEDLANFQRLYGPTQDLSCELVPARVVAAGSLAYDQTRVLGSGARQGAAEGQCVTTRSLLTDRSKALPPKLAVVTANALVGKIIDAGAFTARLRLVTDRDFALRGRIRRIIDPRRPRQVTVTEGGAALATLIPDNNEPIDVMARGDGSRRILVDHVKKYHNVLPGDLLVTSGREEILPTEIHVGKVIQVRPDEADPRRVTLIVQPHADLEALRDVYILAPLGPRGQAP